MKLNHDEYTVSTFNWTNVEKIEHKGETGTSIWQTIQLDNLRIRIVQYSKNYLADHWCQKGHIVHCLEGEFIRFLFCPVKRD